MCVCDPRMTRVPLSQRSQHWLMTVVQQLCQEIGSPRDRSGLVRAIWDAFTGQILDLWDLRRSLEGQSVGRR